jgi:CheY-like chemotaxis protein
MNLQASTILPILVVDDERNYRIILDRVLSTAGYRVLTADHWQEAMRLLKEQPVALILSDMHMPGIDGLALCKLVTRDIGQVPFILFSACLSVNSRREISETVDAWGSLSKPFDNRDVLALIGEVLQASASGLKLPIGRINRKLMSKKLYTYTEDVENS